ncbi:Lysophospholipase NTE1 like protein [Verticillium longisporum]|nr:Lysophospholipase NTE1 like protein [Verticillium longisporum]
MMPSHPPSKRSNTTLKERVQILQAEIQKYTSRKVRHTPYYSPDAPFKGDFHRLARRLCGKLWRKLAFPLILWVEHQWDRLLVPSTQGTQT